MLIHCSNADLVFNLQQDWLILYFCIMYKIHDVFSFLFIYFNWQPQVLVGLCSHQRWSMDHQIYYTILMFRNLDYLNAWYNKIKFRNKWSFRRIIMICCRSWRKLWQFITVYQISGWQVMCKYMRSPKSAKLENSFVVSNYNVFQSLSMHLLPYTFVQYNWLEKDWVTYLTSSNQSCFPCCQKY